MSPLLNYEWTQLVNGTESTEASIVRNQVTGDKFIVRFLTNSGAVQRLMNLHVAAAESEFVVSVLNFGPSSDGIFFSVGEFVVGDLRTRIRPEAQGVEDDEEFWRLATQLSRGVADIHRNGVLHLAVQPANLFLTKHGNLRIAQFFRACTIGHVEAPNENFQVRVELDVSSLELRVDSAR